MFKSISRYFLLVCLGLLSPAFANADDLSVTVTYKSVVKSHIEQFRRHAIYNPNAGVIAGSTFFTRTRTPVKAETSITGAGSLLNDPSLSWLKGVTFSDSIESKSTPGTVQIRFLSNGSTGAPTLVRRSNFDMDCGHFIGTEQPITQVLVG